MLDRPDNHDLVSPDTNLISLARLIHADAVCGNRTEVFAKAEAVCKFIPPHSGIEKAEPYREDDGEITIAVWIIDPHGEHQEPRRLPLLYYVAFLSAVAVGATLYFHDAGDGDKVRTYLRIRPPRRPFPGERIFLSRIIKNTPDGQATPFAEDYRSYRPQDLKQVKDRGKGKPSSIGRPAFIALCRTLLLECFPDGVTVPASLPLYQQVQIIAEADQFAAFIEELLETADAFHGAP